MRNPLLVFCRLLPPNSIKFLEKYINGYKNQKYTSIQSINRRLRAQTIQKVKFEQLKNPFFHEAGILFEEKTKQKLDPTKVLNTR